MGQRITQEQAERFLQEDLAKFERMVERYDGVYRWSQNQFDALVSFSFNIGSLGQLTKNGSRSKGEIAEKMLQYNKSGGKTNAGLTERRKAERDLFLKPAQKEPQGVQAAEASPGHVQMNYQAGHMYTVAAEGLRIRTKLPSQHPDVIRNGKILGTIANRKQVKCLATARVGNQIWMYIGLDGKGREQWLCADTGNKAYIK